MRGHLLVCGGGLGARGHISIEEGFQGRDCEVKVTGIKTHLCHNAGHRYWIFTEVCTDEGITGVSEVGMNQEKTVATAIESLAEYLTGKDPRSVEDHVDKLYRTGYWVGTIRCTAISAVEMCLWDIVGKWL